LTLPITTPTLKPTFNASSQASNLQFTSGRIHTSSSQHGSRLETLINTIFTDIIDATPDNHPIAASTRHHRPNYTFNRPSNRNSNRNLNRNSNRNNSANRFGRGSGFPGVKYECMRCKKHTHTDADCSFKDSAISHIVHQVKVQ
jgi:hypothetical protein